MSARKLQQGSSLIATLVGLGLGCIALAGMASVFKAASFRSVDSRIAAKHDTQVAMALVTLPAAMSKAGYGIGAASNSCTGASVAGPSGTANTDLVVIRAASATSPTSATTTISGTQQTIGALGAAPVSGQGVVWHWNDAGTDRCAGVVSYGGGLKRLPAVACSDATQWDTLTWAPQSLISPNTLPNNGTVGFSASKVASCAPYGMGTSNSGVLVTASVGNSSTGLSTNESICLPNICK